LSFAWYDRHGQRLDAVPIAPGKVIQPRVSPDGRKLAFTRAIGGTADIWTYDFASGATTQVTSDPDYDENSYWSPDGRLLSYQGNEKGERGILIATLDGSRPPVVIARGPRVTVGRFMPDGRSLLISRQGRGNDVDLALVPVDRPDAATAVTSDAGQEIEPAPSPDGRWVAFVTTRTGRPEVVLAPVVAESNGIRLGGQRPVSSAGGSDPDWRRDGREIVYRAVDNTLMAVSVTFAGGGVSLGKPAPLFKATVDAGGASSSWAATPDHTKFIIVESPGAAGQRFRVLTDWIAK
jgi:Tol biopolymer transport system component